MVLEYLDGRTVQRELEIDGPFAPARVLHIARQALHALGAAHASASSIATSSPTTCC